MAFELPRTWRGGDELQGLTVDAYDDAFSAYWNSNTSYAEFVEICFHRASPDAETHLDAGEDSLSATLHDVADVAPEAPKLLVVYIDTHSLSWEPTVAQSYTSEIGVTADAPNSDLVKEVFESLEPADLSSESLEEIDHFLKEHVHR